MAETKFNIPTILVVFGATGDLMKKKIIPALFHLYEQDELPKLFQVIGFSRRALSDSEFREQLVAILKHYHRGTIDQKKLKGFLALFNFQQGSFESSPDYQKLANRLGRIDDQWRVCTNKLFYLSVPPQYYRQIFEHLKSTRLSDPCGPEEGWTRILVEKPFGNDLQTARELDVLLSQLFKEEQIYRIDHYLAKEMLQNILAFRFANNLFEGTWNNSFIERIDIRLLESIGVEDRGSFYDSVGALRDVGQNHLLQMLALVAMEHPESYAPGAIRRERAEVLERVRILNQREVAKATFRAQYEGYRGIRGVDPHSTTETYFKLCTELTSPRWQGVAVAMESGKRLGEPQKEIVVTFKHTYPCLCPPDKHYKNRVVFRLEPLEEIRIDFLAKKPGLRLEMEQRSFEFLLHKKRKRTQYVEEYGKLILDCIAGDQTLFVSTEEIEKMWRIIDPIVKAWDAKTVPLHSYKPDTNEIREQALACDSLPESELPKEVGVVGLGKMGAGVARHLLEQGWRVVGYNRSPDDTNALEQEGLEGAYSPRELVEKLPSPRVVWLMLPAGEAIDSLLFDNEGVISHLVKGDIVIDAGNSYYKDSIRRAEKLQKLGIHFIDVGFSGGPAGARYGGCLMIGGEKKIARELEPLFQAASKEVGYEFFDGVGAGHFVKMIHNGIEYGMMQAIAEGFAILKKADYKLDLNDVARIYNNGSVIESRLVGWLQQGFEVHGVELKGVSGSVKHTGEGLWTVKTAKELGVEAKIIEGALKFRQLSENDPSYTGKVLSTLREQFGGHSVK